MSRTYVGNPCKRGHLALRYISNGDCVVCSRKRRRQWARDNAKINRKRVRKWREANPELRKAQARRDGRAKSPKPTRRCPRRCEMCRQPPEKMALHLDHCHTEKTFRGWLCQKCNCALGLLGDDLKVAIARLKRYQRRQV
jgi:hypothetical protein